jgi:hypothetical protein
VANNSQEGFEMKPLVLIPLMFLLALAAPTWAGDLLISNSIGAYEPQISTLSEGLPGSDGLSGYLGHTLSYAGPDGVVQVEIREYDDTRWLAHNIEGQLRHTAIGDQLGALSETATIKVFAAGNALCLDALNSNCWWVSGNLSVRISGKNPEAVIDAYLGQLPPTHATLTPDSEWAASEMERLLEAAGGRLDLLAQGSAGEDLPAWVNQDLSSFLQYRDKYYGIDATAERVHLGEALRDGDEAALREKLEQYKGWWNSHR